MTISQENRVRWPFRVLAGIIALCGIFALSRVAREFRTGVSLSLIADLVVIVPFTAAMTWVTLYGSSPRWWIW